MLSFGKPSKSVVSVTGILDYSTNEIKESAYLKDYRRKPIARDVQEILNCEVVLEQDSICCALAELDNLATNLEEFALVTVTYGIGGVFVRKTGNSLRVFSTELGHTIVVPNGRVCACGQRGCVEAYIGGTSLQEGFLVRPEDIKQRGVWEEAVEYLSIATSNLLLCFPTEQLIYSGHSISTIPALKRGIKQKLNQQLQLYLQPKVQISSLAGKANIYGGLKLLQITSNLFSLERVK